MLNSSASCFRDIGR